MRTKLILRAFLLLALGFYEVSFCQAADVIGARIVQGEFQSRADQASFQEAVGNSFGNEFRLDNPASSLGNGDGSAYDYFGYSVAISNDTAVIGAVWDSIGVPLQQGSAYVFVRFDGKWNLEGKLIASDGSKSDRFGNSVAISGDRAIVGASARSNGTVLNQGAAYVFTRSAGVWSQQSKLVANDGAEGDQFGISVAISEESALVGAYADSVNGNEGQGSAYVFKNVGGTWNLQTKLTKSDGASGDLFGASVALEGDTALIGAYLDDVGAGINQGTVSVFQRANNVWTTQAQLTPDDGSGYEFFGDCLALSGNTVIVGAPGDNAGAAITIGAAFVFTRSGNSWSQEAKLMANDGSSGDRFGDSVGLSGEIALVGAVFDAFGANDQQGSAYIFTRLNGVWSQQAKLVADDGAKSDWFGEAVALSGESAIIGARFADIFGRPNQGAAYEFSRINGVWQERAKLNSGLGASFDNFASSMAIFGDTALIAAAGSDVGRNTNQGSVYVFVRDKSGWNFQQVLTALDGAAGDRFGSSVAISGDTAVIGAPNDNIAGPEQGSAYIFVRQGGSWVQQTKLSLSDGGIYDRFGKVVAISGDTAIVSHDERAVSGNANQGAAFVFFRTGSVWTQQAMFVASDGAAQDNFATSVSVSGDRALIGAPGADIGTRLDQGAAYVFVRSANNWTQQSKLLAEDGLAGDYYGYSLSLFGNHAVVGAYLKDVGPNIDQGAAYVLEFLDNQWLQQARLISTDGRARDYFGFTVVISCNNALVAPFNADNGTNSEKGSAYVFSMNDDWQESAKLTASDGLPNDGFGSALAIFGENALIGASRFDSAGVFGNPSVGRAYAYTDDRFFIDGFEPDLPNCF